MTFRYADLVKESDKAVQVYVDLMCKMGEKVDGYLLENRARPDFRFYPPKVSTRGIFEDFMDRALQKRMHVRVMTNEDLLVSSANQSLIAPPGYTFNYGEMVPLAPLELEVRSEESHLWFLDLRWRHPGFSLTWGGTKPKGRIYMGLMRSTFQFDHEVEGSWHIKDGCPRQIRWSWLFSVVSDDKSRDKEKKEVEAKAAAAVSTPPVVSPAV